MKINNKQIKIILIYFFIFHILLWTVIPSLTNINLPLDTIEALNWGNELRFGYDKYPPIFPLFTELFFKIFGNQDWAYYLLSQLFVTSSFLIIFQFSKYFFDNQIYSLLSVLLLEGVYFFNFTTPELNAFICLLPFIAITALFCWRAIIFNKNLDWIMFGLFAGISTLTYYLSLYILASISIFFIGEIIINKKFNYKYILALIVYFFVLSPHLYFIFENDFKSIEYALFRSFGDPLSGIGEYKILDHMFYPLIFLIKQLVILIPFLFLLSTFISNFSIKFKFNDRKLIFLFTIAVLPIVLMFLTSLIGGVRIRTMWMTTFYLFVSIFFMYLFKANINLQKYKKFLILFLFVFIVPPIAYGIDSYIQKGKRTDYPGKSIATKVQIEWNKNFSDKIKIIVGKSWVYGGWYGGNLSYHLEGRPKLQYVEPENIKEGLILINILHKMKMCKGILVKIEPYFEVCMIGKKNSNKISKLNKRELRFSPTS
jgi:4-amino-4-deoxy-L-arabinose transferase-like glycosyltransferase